MKSLFCSLHVDVLLYEWCAVKGYALAVRTYDKQGGSVCRDRPMYSDELRAGENYANEAADFQAACRIRSYANAILSEKNLSDERRQYAEWALKKADWLDPTIESNDEYFGKRKHGEKIEKRYRYF